MADVNAGISDLRNWEQVNFSPTITKDGDSYTVGATYITGTHEKLVYNIKVKENKDYTLSFDCVYPDHEKNIARYTDYVAISSMLLPDAFIEEITGNFIIKKTEISSGIGKYIISFNSGPNDSLYITILFNNFKDNRYYEATFGNIKLKSTNEGPDYLIESAYKTAYYFKDGEKIDTFCYMVLIRDEDILETLPKEITPSSWAYTAAGKKVWQMDFDREWIPVFDEDE